MDDDETRVMSEALTRGATMLDDACDDCGNPLFRYQDEVFCAVCRGLGSDDEGASGVGAEVRGTTREARDVSKETDDAPIESKATGEGDEVRDGADAEARGVEESLRVLARRLARDAAESADDPEAVERRLDALERTLGLLR